MTRINCIPVNQLHYKHLIAEYRELPRIFTLVANAQAKGKTPRDFHIPKYYCLGKGHVTFFYDKLMWLKNRYVELTIEMHDRGYKISYDPTTLGVGIDPIWFGDWEPTRMAKYRNRKRINQRLKEMSSR